MAGEEEHIDFKLYRYTPSVAAAVLFIVLFVLITAYHLYQVIRARCWYFLVFVVGGVFQIIGYICRVLAHSDKENVPIYAVQTILILLAPPLYAASIYMTLGRLIRHLNAEHLSLISVKWLTGIFVTGDVLSFLMQGSGGGIMASGTISAMNTGEYVTIGGLCVQLLFFGVFVIVAIIFHRRILNSPTAVSQATASSGSRLPWNDDSWQGTMWGLYVSSVLILVRSIFRLIEYAQGNSGYLISHEAFMYVFDSMLMFFAMIALSVWHPSKFLGDGKKGVKEGSEEEGELTEVRS